MKKLLYIVFAFVFFGCNSERAPDCFKSTGTMIQRDIPVSDFEAIDVFDKVEVIIKQSDTLSVVLESGINLIDDVKINVYGETLVIQNENTCNYFREYGMTKVYISVPNLKTIRNSSGAPIVSDGVWAFENLFLSSENSESIGDFRVDGLFDIEVKCENLRVVVNNLCTNTIKGAVANLSVSYANGDARFEGRELIAEKVTISHRGTNDIIVNPQKSLKGKLTSTGHLILVNKPDELDVEELYTGRLIIE